MPIGIPKVRYKKHQNKKYPWIDIFTKISQDRVLFLTQKLELETTNQMIRVLLYLKLENKEKITILYINCSSSNNLIKYGLSIVDTISYVQNVNTINFGSATSIVSLVRASGKKGKRLALPHSRFRPYLSVKKSSGQALVISQEVNEKDQLLNKIRHMYIKMGCRFDKLTFKTFTPLKISQYYQKISRTDSFQTFENSSEPYNNIKKSTINYLNSIKIISASQAITIGLVDKIGKNLYLKYFNY